MQKYVITIARGYGSGGKTIGKMLSEQLGIPFYDREIIRMASEDSGISEEIFGKADEKLKPTLFRSPSNVYKGGLIAPESSNFVSDENLFNYQAKIIKALAEKESCVIVGRCADFVLAGADNLIRIFVYADESVCVSNLMDIYGMSEKDALKKIASIDKHRSDYYRYYTGSRWDNVRNYDLCLNSGDLGFEKCVDIVKNFVKIRLA